MKKDTLPKTDSIQELADFLQTHDLTDFENELIEVTEPVFAQRKALRIQLEAPEAEAVRSLAEAKGVSQEELVRSWVLQNLSRRNGRKAKKRPPAHKN
jgi:hypothetical protein